MFTALIAGHPKKMIFRLSMVFLLLAGGVMGAVYTLNMTNRAQAQKAQMLERAHVRAQDKAGTFAQWFSEVSKTAKSLTTSDLVRIYLTEQQQNNTKQGENTALAQRSYIEHTLGDIQNRLKSRGVLLLSPQGKTLLKSPKTAFLSVPPASTPTRLKASQGDEPVMGQIVQAKGKTYLEVFVPIHNLAEKSQQEVVGLLYLQASLSEVMEAFSAPRAHYKTSPHDNTLFAAQNAQNQWQALTTAQDLLTGSVAPNAKGVQKKPDGTKVLQGAYMFPSQRHAIIHHTDYTWAMADYAAYSKLYILMLVVMVAAMGMIFIGLLWYGIAKRDKRRVQHLGQMVDAFMKAVESRDPYLLGHHKRVARLALDMGNQLELSVRERATLYYSANLAGIGRMFIPEKILNKKTALTAKEREIMEQHVNHTLHILDDVTFDLPVKETIEQMHERSDGSGYPNGLTLADIDIKAQILGLCDTYCALVESRAYRQGLSHEQAMAEIQNNAEKFSHMLIHTLENKRSD